MHIKNQRTAVESNGNKRGRCRNPESVEFATLGDANRVRRRLSDIIIPRDDARQKTICYCGDAPRPARETVGHLAYRSFEERPARYGQTPLSRFERQEIDFTETNVFHARASKAISVEFLVDDWLGFYDTTLTVDEHVEIYRRAGQPTAEASGPTLREASAGWSA